MQRSTVCGVFRGSVQQTICTLVSVPYCEPRETDGSWDSQEQQVSPAFQAGRVWAAPQTKPAEHEANYSSPLPLTAYHHTKYTHHLVSSDLEYSFQDSSGKSAKSDDNLKVRSHGLCKVDRMLIQS